MLIAGSKTHGLKCCTLASFPILSYMLSSNRNTDKVLRPTTRNAYKLITTAEPTEVKNSLTETKHLMTVPIKKNTSFM